MKNIGIVAFCLVLSACKYEDGPSISFRSASSRVQGFYNISKFEVNGMDSTNAIKQQHCYTEIKFLDSDPDNEISMGFGSSCHTIGIWKLKNNDKKIYLKFNLGAFKGIGPFGTNNQINSTEATWNIEKLKDDEMIFTTIFNNTHYKILLKE